MEIINIKRYYCPHCGHDQLNKKGYTPDKRQRYKCLGCGKSSTENVRKMGQPKFDKAKLLPIMSKDPKEFTKEELYSLGWLIADGSLSKTHQMSITIKQEDEYALEYIRQSLNINNTVKKAKCGKKGEYYSRLTWGYKHADKYWKELGLVQDKTGNEIWLDYMKSTHFIRGFFDGDGHFSNKRLGFSCSCLKFCQSLQEVIFEEIANLGSLSFSKGVYNLQYYGINSIKLGDWLYQDSEDLRLERKYKKYLELKNVHKTGSD